MSKVLEIFRCFLISGHLTMSSLKLVVQIQSFPFVCPEEKHKTQVGLLGCWVPLVAGADKLFYVGAELGVHQLGRKELIDFIFFFLSTTAGDCSLAWEKTLWSCLYVCDVVVGLTFGCKFQWTIVFIELPVDFHNMNIWEFEDLYRERIYTMMKMVFYNIISHNCILFLWREMIKYQAHTS